MFLKDKVLSVKLILRFYNQVCSWMDGCWQYQFKMVARCDLPTLMSQQISVWMLICLNPVFYFFFSLCCISVSVSAPKPWACRRTDATQTDTSLWAREPQWSVSPHFRLLANKTRLTLDELLLQLRHQMWNTARVLSFNTTRNLYFDSQ